MGPGRSLCGVLGRVLQACSGRNRDPVRAAKPKQNDAEPQGAGLAPKRDPEQRTGYKTARLPTVRRHANYFSAAEVYANAVVGWNWQRLQIKTAYQREPRCRHSLGTLKILTTMGGRYRRFPAAYEVSVQDSTGLHVNNESAFTRRIALILCGPSRARMRIGSRHPRVFSVLAISRRAKFVIPSPAGAYALAPPLPPSVPRFGAVEILGRLLLRSTAEQ